MTIRIGPRLIAFFALGFLALAAVFLVLHSTPEGLGLSDDSIAYIAGARSMLAGNGYREAWLASSGPVTHFPPGYPASLAALGWFGLDPLRGARFLNAVLFGLSTVVIGILGWRMTRSILPGLLLAVLFLLNPSLLEVHANALSEPLFIFLSLLAFWMFDLYAERDAHWLWLVACGVLAGAAYLTRYAALALAATFILGLLALHRTWRRRWISIGVFGAGFVPGVAAWAVRNAAVGGTVTNRVLVWHPIQAGNLEMSLRTISMFLMPIEPWRAFILKSPVLLVGAALFVLVAIALWTFGRVRDRTNAPGSAGGEVISLISGVYVFCYIGAIFAAMSFFDASTKFRVRILAPVYVAVLIVAVAIGFWLWKRRREAAVAAAIVVLAISSLGQVGKIAELRRGGQGYASFRWYDSKAMVFLKGLPQGTMVFTNEPGAVYLYTGRGAYVLPDRIDPVTAEVRPGFDAGVQEMQSAIKAGKAVLALFSGGDSPPSDTAALSAGLYLAQKVSGAEIYTAGP
jgi:4-amino-4-deoxy-L-arabinose transferase-like glycosyltransferase